MTSEIVFEICNGLTEFILLSNYNEENKQLVEKRNDPVRNSSSENDFDYNYDLYYNAAQITVHSKRTPK